MELGKWILIGGLVVVLVMVLIAACLFSKKHIKSTPPPKVEGKSDTEICQT